MWRAGSVNMSAAASHDSIPNGDAAAQSQVSRGFSGFKARRTLIVCVCVCAWACESLIEKERERVCRKREGSDEEKKREAVWEEAAMLVPKRDWEGEGSLLTEWIFKEGPHRGWEGQRVCVCVTLCVYVNSYWLLFYTTSPFSSPSFLSFHCAIVNKCPPCTTSSPLANLDAPASPYRLNSLHAHQESLIDCPFTPFNNQLRTWFQEESLWEVGREESWEGASRGAKDRGCWGKQQQWVLFFSLSSSGAAERTVGEGRWWWWWWGGYFRPQPAALWMLGVRPVSPYSAQRRCMFCGKEDRVWKCSACSLTLADNEQKRGGGYLITVMSEGWEGKPQHYGRKRGGSSVVGCGDGLVGASKHPAPPPPPLHSPKPSASTNMVSPSLRDTEPLRSLKPARHAIGWSWNTTPLPLHPYFHSFSPGVLRSVSPFHLSLRRCLHSILLSQFGLCCFPFPLYSFRVCFATASPLSSVHLIIYTVLTSHLSVVYFSSLLSALSLRSLSTHPFGLPISTSPCCLSSLSPSLPIHLIRRTILPSNPYLSLLPW